MENVVVIINRITFCKEHLYYAKWGWIKIPPSYISLSTCSVIDIVIMHENGSSVFSDFNPTYRLLKIASNIKITLDSRFIAASVKFM